MNKVVATAVAVLSFSTMVPASNAGTGLPERPASEFASGSSPTLNSREIHRLIVGKLQHDLDRIRDFDWRGMNQSIWERDKLQAFAKEAGMSPRLEAGLARAEQAVLSDVNEFNRLRGEISSHLQSLITLLGEQDPSTSGRAPTYGELNAIIQNTRSPLINESQKWSVNNILRESCLVLEEIYGWQDSLRVDHGLNCR